MFLFCLHFLILLLLREVSLVIRYNNRDWLGSCDFLFHFHFSWFFCWLLCPNQDYLVSARNKDIITRHKYCSKYVVKIEDVIAVVVFDLLTRLTICSSVYFGDFRKLNNRWDKKRVASHSYFIWLSFFIKSIARS